MKSKQRIKIIISFACLSAIWAICNWCFYLKYLPNVISDGYFEHFEELNSDYSASQCDNDLLKPMPAWFSQSRIATFPEEYQKTAVSYFSDKSINEKAKKIDDLVKTLPDKKLSQHINHINNPSAFIVNPTALHAYIDECVNVVKADEIPSFTIADSLRYITNIYRWCQAVGIQYKSDISYGGDRIPHEFMAKLRISLLNKLIEKINLIKKLNPQYISSNMLLKTELLRLSKFIDYEPDREDYAIEREQCLKAALNSVKILDEKSLKNDNDAQKSLRIEIAHVYPVFVERRIAEYHKSNYLFIKDYLAGKTSKAENVERIDLGALRRKQIAKKFFSIFWASLYVNAEAEFLAYSIVKPYNDKEKIVKYPELFIEAKNKIQRLAVEIHE